MTDTEKPCCLDSFDHAKAEGRITAAEGLRIIGAERVKDKAALLETLKTLLPGVEIELTDIKLTAE